MARTEFEITWIEEWSRKRLVLVDLDDVREWAGISGDVQGETALGDDTPQLVAALRAVLDAHKPVTATSTTMFMVRTTDPLAAAEAAQTTQCRRCFGDQWHPFGSYPCQELAAVAAALETP